jgi:hypothetical protein
VTVNNATGNRQADQARALLEKQWEEEELEDLRQENARLRAQLQLPERARRGRLPKRSTAEDWTLKRAKKLCGDGRTAMGREARAFVQELHDNGVGGAGLRALIGVVLVQCDQLMEADQMEPRFALGTKLKAIETLIKVREIEAMEAAEVPNQVSIHVVHHYDGDGAPEAIDVTPREES